MRNLNSLLRILLQHDIEFILIGGYASVLHGSTYVTRDLDICGIISSDQIEKLRIALKDLHPRHRMNPNFKPSFLEEPKELHWAETKTNWWYRSSKRSWNSKKIRTMQELPGR